jgi:hypothetical protein
MEFLLKVGPGLLSPFRKLWRRSAAVALTQKTVPSAPQIFRELGSRGPGFSLYLLRCAYCQGTGRQVQRVATARKSVPEYEAKLVRCVVCSGRRAVRVELAATPVSCTHCSGIGIERPGTQKPCRACYGSGAASADKVPVTLLRW